MMGLALMVLAWVLPIHIAAKVLITIILSTRFALQIMNAIDEGE